MTQTWLRITTERGNAIAPSAFAKSELPLPDVEYIKYAADWRELRVAERKARIGEIRAADVRNKSILLFVLWTWEPKAELRAEIIRGFPRDERELSTRILAIIFRHEPPDGNGRAVR